MTTCVSMADGIAAVALFYALVVLTVYRRRLISNVQLGLLTAVTLVYFLLNLLNLLESTGLSRRMLDAPESTFKVLGVGLVLFFFLVSDQYGQIKLMRSDIEGQQSTIKSLDRSRERLTELLNTIPDPLFVLTSKGTVTFINSAFRRSFLPETVDELAFRAVPVEELPVAVRSLVARCPYQEVVARNEAITRALNLPAKGTGGTVYHTNVFPLRDTEGQVKEIVYHLHDITPESQMLECMVRERRSRSLFSLVSGLAHEFNNIFAGISGVTQLMQVGDLTSEEVQDYAQKASNLVERGTKLVEELLGTTGEPRAGTKTLLADFLPLLSRVLNDVLPAGIRLRMEVAQDLHPAEVSASEMEVALVNLVMNAAEASLPGGTVVIEAGNVLLASEEAPEIYLPASEQFVRLAIIDSGRGVHPQDRQRIFDPFFTTKKTHKGMGLPVASSIVGRERGMLRLEKSDELGTTFAVYLPCRSPSQSAATDSATEDSLDSSAD